MEPVPYGAAPAQIASEWGRPHMEPVPHGAAPAQIASEWGRPHMEPVPHKSPQSGAGPELCQNPGSECPTRGLKILLIGVGSRKFSKFGASGTSLVPGWHQTTGSTSLSPRCPWWQKPGQGDPWLRTHGWAPIAAQPRPAPDAPRRPAPFPLSIVSRFFSRVGPRRVPCVCVWR